MWCTFVSLAANLSALNAFKSVASQPGVIGVPLPFGLHFLLMIVAADVIFNSAGRFVVRDQGLVSIVFKLMLKFIDLNFFWSALCPSIPITHHYQRDRRSVRTPVRGLRQVPRGSRQGQEAVVWSFGLTVESTARHTPPPPMRAHHALSLFVVLDHSCLIC
jgi:hypothetical protein